MGVFAPVSELKNFYSAVKTCLYNISANLRIFMIEYWHYTCFQYVACDIYSGKFCHSFIGLIYKCM